MARVWLKHLFDEMMHKPRTGEELQRVHQEDPRVAQQVTHTLPHRDALPHQERIPTIIAHIPVLFQKTMQRYNIFSYLTIFFVVFAQFSRNLNIDPAIYSFFDISA